MKINFNIKDWDADFVSTMKNGVGFLIDTNIDYSSYLNTSQKGKDDKDIVDISKIKEVFSLDSIYSYKFGMSNQIDSDDPVLKKMYTCQCHKLYGIEHINELCDKCNTYVQRSIPMQIGWISLGENYILHPFLCSLLMSSKKSIKTETEVIEFEDVPVVTDKDLEDVDVIEDDAEFTMPKHTKRRKKKIIDRDKVEKFTMFELLTRGKLDYTWEDILFNGQLDNFLDKYFKNTSRYKVIKEHMKGRRAFVSHIEVLSAEYRPMKIKSVIGIPEITQSPINAHYMAICDDVRSLMLDKDTMIKIMKIKLLVDIMKNLAQICKIVEDEIAGNKKAMIRGEIYSRRSYNSARLVIEPITDKVPDIDVCQLPVDVFRVIFGENILSILNKYPNIDAFQRHRLIDVNVTLTHEEKRFIIDEIFPQIENPIIYMNREPCIYMTSVLGMRIIELKEDELVMRIPFSILGGIAGDFDGDEMGSIAWETPRERKLIYNALTPRKSVINTSYIKYNSKIGLNNNTAVLFYKGMEKDPIIKKIKKGK